MDIQFKVRGTAELILLISVSQMAEVLLEKVFKGEKVNGSLVRLW